MSNKTTVSLGSALDIMHASGLKERLQAALGKKDNIVLIADKVERADTAGLQLIYAFIQEVDNQGKNISWQKPTNELMQACEVLGLCDALQIEAN